MSARLLQIEKWQSVLINVSARFSLIQRNRRVLFIEIKTRLVLNITTPPPLSLSLKGNSASPEANQNRIRHGFGGG